MVSHKVADQKRQVLTVIRPMNLKNIERKMKDFNENLTLFDQQFIIIPYKPSGYVDYSNLGQVQGQRYINDYETYKRVWTGNDSFIVTWKDSIEFRNTRQDETIKYTYKLGDFFAGWLEQNSSDVEIDVDNSFSEYKAQTTEKTLTFRINAAVFDLDTNYEFMFYKVPEIYGSILFRVQSLEREYLGKDLMCYVLTIKSLNQELANTGRAKQQNVMPNAPGAGYWDAQISTTKPQGTPPPVAGKDYIEFYGRYIVADKTKQIPNPCRKVVFKAFGMCALSNVAFLGRKTRVGNTLNKFGIPEWIFPMNFKNATTYTLYRTQNEQANYFWIRNLAPIIQFNQNSMNALQGLLSMTHFWTSEGFAWINEQPGVKPKEKSAVAEEKKTGIDEMRATNPVSSYVDGIPQSDYPEQLFGKIINQAGILKYQPWMIDVPAYPNGKGAQTDLVYGCAQYYDDSGKKSIHDVMFHTFWKQKNLKVLPISMRNTLDFGWTISSGLSMISMGLWYGAAAMIGIGIVATAYQYTIAPKFQGFSCIAPASLMDFMVQESASIFTTNLLGKVRLSYFTSYEDNNEINKLFNTETLNTSFEADLTDTLKYAYSSGTIRKASTACIGQTVNENGDYLLSNGKPFLLDGKQELVALIDDYEGFIIDAIHIQGLFQGDYSIEFLDYDNNVIWSGVYQSQGKWAKSIREINTWINTSIYGRENMFIEQPVRWPEAPPPLDFVAAPAKPIEKTFNDTEYAKKLEFRLGTTFGNMLTSGLSLSVVNWNSERVLLKPSASRIPITNAQRITIFEGWSGTIDEFEKQYNNLTLTINFYHPQGWYTTHEVSDLKISQYENIHIIDVFQDKREPLRLENKQVGSSPGAGLQTIYMDVGFVQKVQWKITYKIMLISGSIVLDYRLSPNERSNSWESKLWRFRYVSGGVSNTWIDWEEWKDFNTTNLYGWKMNSRDVLVYGSFITKMLVKPKRPAE